MVQASEFLIGLDDGHGPHTAGKRTPFISSLGRQIHENEFNKSVVDLLEKELKQCGFRTIQIAPTDIDTPLKERTDKANRFKCDLLLSIHFNAMGSTFFYSSSKGFSVHIQPTDKSNPNSGSLKFAKLAIEELSKGTPQVNRGIVGQNLHMTRETSMPAALIECGFMDDLEEALLMINPAFQKEVAQELTRVVCRYFEVPYKAIAGVAKLEKEEEITMSEILKLTTGEGKNALLRVLSRFEKKDPALGKMWRQKVLDGTFTKDDSHEVLWEAINRGYITGKTE